MLIRSLRNFKQEYETCFSTVPNSVEIIRNSTIIDIDDSNSSVITDDDFPSAIFLQASINPEKITSQTKLLRTEDNRTFEINNIYDEEFFHRDSEVKNHFCASVSLVYENAGYYSLNGEKYDLLDKEMQNFQLNFPDVLFKMQFDVCNTSCVQENSSASQIIEKDGSKVFAKFYPYGGFYVDGCHPKQIEACVCQAMFENNLLKIKSYAFSSLLNRGTDVRKDSKRFKKVNFSSSPSVSLYDKIRGGECQIELIS